MGQGIALILSRKFENFDKLISFFLNSQSDEKIDGVGDIILNSIKSYFKDEHNLEQVEQLLKIINLNFEKKNRGNFSNKTIVITGTFKKFSRKKIEKILIEKGAIISSSVSKKTDLLFVVMILEVN